MPEKQPKPTEETIYGSIPMQEYDKTRDHQIRFFAQTFAGRRVCHIREFWKPKVDVTWRAGKGLTFKPIYIVDAIMSMSRMMVGENVGPEVPDALAEYVGKLIHDATPTTMLSDEIDFTEVARTILPDLLAAGAVLESVGRTK